MTPEDVEKYIKDTNPLPHIEYHKNDPEIYFQKEETDEKSERDSSGHPRTDDA